MTQGSPPQCSPGASADTFEEYWEYTVSEADGIDVFETDEYED